MQGHVPSFRDINRIICALEEEHERGLAFELFAEGFLKTDPVLRARNVYTMKDLPPHLLARLGIKGQDWGIDRIVETEDGDLITVQSKHRIDPGNSVTFNQISGFLYQSELAAGRMVITTSNRAVFDRGLRNNDSVQKITARHLRDLSPDRLEAIISYILTDATSAPLRKVERDDQTISVAKIVEGLSLHNRGIFDAACGSGKTLVSERVIETLFAETGGLVLCLAPSLSLVRQTLRNHAQELAGLGLNASFAVVCSDHTVADDVSQQNKNVSDISADDLGVPVTTDSAQLAAFLTRTPRHREIKIIFSTYQSSAVVEEALKETGQVVGLSIFDEAHKTVTKRSSADSDFTRALFDEFIPSLKRLFMTATVKTRRLAKGRIDDSASTFLFSMDRTDLYGPIIHRFSHSQAIAKGVIRAPKLILCTVDPTELPADLRDLEISVDGLSLSGDAAVELFALRQATEKTGASKVISFHTKTTAAKAFARLVRQTMPDFLVGHVNCTQRVSERDTAVDYLRVEGRQALVSNVRCLAEGIDVPEVDMIALFGHFSSKIDIAQMIGRSLRKPAGCHRDYGYILVPVVISNPSDGELSTEDMLDKAGLQTIRQVICAMMDMDDDFAELMQRFRIAKGVGNKKVLSSISRECLRYFECVGFAAEALTAAMTTSVLPEISEDFWFHLGEFQAFVAANGHSNLPPGFESSTGKNLYVWLDNQKTKIRKGAMPKDRAEALMSLGVSTLGYGQRMDINLKKVEDFHAVHGHLDFPSTAAFKPLREFAKLVRRKHQTQTLSANVKAVMERLGFIYEKDDEAEFQAELGRLQAFYKQNGHSTVTRAHPDKLLHRFSERMKSDGRNGRLSKERVKALDAIEFPWNARVVQAAQTFDRMLDALTESFKETGNAALPRSYQTADGFAVGRHLDQCRQQMRCNEISDRNRKRLAAIGITEAIRIDLVEKKKVRSASQKVGGPTAEERRRDASFEAFIEVLKRYIAQGGEANVPQNGKGSLFEGRNLGNQQNHWLKKWRKLQLSEDKIAQLVALGVEQYRIKPKASRKRAA
jgi:superfamily II DNA or RNA helicase